MITCGDDNILAEARDISVGGMFVHGVLLPFGQRVVVHMTEPGEVADVSLPAVVRWVHDGGVGLQFWLLGVRETHVITEIVARYERGNRRATG